MSGYSSNINNSRWVPRHLKGVLLMMDDLLDAMNAYACHPHRRGERLDAERAWKELFDTLALSWGKLPKCLRLKNMPVKRIEDLP